MTAQTGDRLLVRRSCLGQIGRHNAIASRFVVFAAGGSVLRIGRRRRMTTFVSVAVMAMGMPVVDMPWVGIRKQAR